MRVELLFGGLRTLARITSIEISTGKSEYIALLGEAALILDFDAHAHEIGLKAAGLIDRTFALRSSQAFVEIRGVMTSIQM